MKKIISEIIRFFRKDSGLGYLGGVKFKKSKIGDLVQLADDFTGTYAFGELKIQNGELIIDQMYSYVIITDELKESILAGSVDRFYYEGIIVKG